MDGTRPRRSQDQIRQQWYALWRAMRFARHLGYEHCLEQQQEETARHPTNQPTDQNSPRSHH
ncbi:MAG: hypothetical protein ACK4RK_11900 [Gemmataceae bacterium]